MWFFKKKQNSDTYIGRDMKSALAQLDEVLEAQDVNATRTALYRIKENYDYRDNKTVNTKLQEALVRFAAFDYEEALGVLVQAAVNIFDEGFEDRQEKLLETGLVLMEEQKDMDFNSALSNLRTVSMFARGLRITVPEGQNKRLRDEWERAVDCHVANDDLYEATQEIRYACNWEKAGLSTLANRKWSEVVGDVARTNPARAKELAKIALHEHASDEVTREAQALVNTL